MKTKTIVITGALASSRSRENTLTNFAQLALNNKTTDIETFGCMSIRKAIRAVNDAVRDGFNVLVVAKSLGAYRFWKREDDIEPFSLARTVSIVLIDPHFLAVKNLKQPCYIPDVMCFRQLKYPAGASIYGYTRLLLNTDHFAIADITTDAGRIVAHYVRAEFERLER